MLRNPIGPLKRLTQPAFMGLWQTWNAFLF